MRRLAFCVLVFACLQDAVSAQAGQPDDVGDALAFSKTETFWTEAEVRVLEAQGRVGKDPEHALVPLLFGAAGHLLTPREYNTDPQAAEATSSSFYTDLKTYRAVMKELVASGSQASVRLRTATTAYVGGIGLDAASTVYLYDPYQKFYRTDEEWKTIEKADEVRSPARDAP